LTITQKEYFDEAARRSSSNAVLVPGASRFRNIVIDRAMRKALTPVFKNFRRLSILEVGCGVGRWTEKMANENAVIGVDLSPFMLKMAKDRCKGKDCSFLVADVSFLPFKKNVFDLVVSITVLQHILNGRRHFQALSEIARCGRSKTMIVEEMWSTDVTLLKNVYCPIRVVPVNSYVEDLWANHLCTREFSGITPAIFTVILTRFLARKPGVTEGTLNAGVKSSRLLSGVVHLVMGAGMLSAVFAPIGRYNPRSSLHTILIADKKNVIDSKNNDENRSLGKS